MYFYRYGETYYTSNKPLKGFIEITQEEYEQALEQIMVEAAEQEAIEDET